MSSIRDLKRRIDEVGLDGLRLEISTKAAAKAALADIRLREKQLRAIKREINAACTAIRSEYSRRRQSAGSGGSFVLEVFGKRGAAGKYRAAAKSDLRRAQDSDLKPYLELKTLIDHTLVESAQSKAEIERARDKFSDHAAIQSGPSTGARYCPNCGSGVKRSDKFCSGCGKKLIT